MPSIEERIVSIAFENQVFESRVATTMATLGKLDTTIKNIGGTSGFSSIEAQANKVTLQGPMSALDRLKAKLGLASQGAAEGLGGIDAAGNKVTLQGPQSALDRLKSKLFGASTGAAEGLGGIDQAGNKVTLQGPQSALDRLRAKLGGASRGAAEGLGGIEREGNKVTLAGPSNAVDKLQGKMGKLSAGTTFTDIEKASNKVELHGLTKALDNVTQKFSVLEGAASVALGNIASKAALKGGSFAKSFAFGPARQGFEEYQTNLGSIQTILSNTEGQQVSGLKNTNKYLGELNTYSDKTIYNFSEMAKNIGTFTAAGVDLPKATSSIKGIANLAAMSGSNSQQAATAMYQLSQAISSGKVGLQDWNSVVNAGMGGAVFQKALARTATNMGAVEKGAVKVDKATGKMTISGQSFRESISGPGPHWLTGDVLTETLKQLSGDMTAGELKAKGFTAAQVKAIQAQAKTAQDAATQVKTLPQVFDIARETIGSGWAKSFQLIFGNFEEAKKTFTEFSNFINGFINKVSDARNKVLGEWKKLGGRVELIEGIKDAFHALMGIILPIKDAFREIFPAKTGKDLFEFTKNFHDLMSSLIPAPSTMNNLSRIFAGLFAAIHIGWTFVKELGKAFFDLLGIVGKGSGGFLGFIAGIGDFVVALDASIAKGDAFKGIFKTLGAILAVPLKLLTSMAKAIGSLFGADDNQKLSDRNSELERFGKVLTPAERLVNNLKDAWEKLIGAFAKAKSALEPWFSSFVDKIKGFGTLIADAFKNMDFDKVMSGLQTGIMAGIFVAIKKVLGKGGPLSEITGVLGGVNKLIGGFTGQMEAMQSKLKAEALLAIAGAVAILAAGLFVLSTIKGEDLQKALTASAIGLGELMGAMKLMTTGMGKLGVLQLPVIAAGMIGLGIAVVILAGAMKIFATMDWQEIGKGLVGVAGSIGAVGAGMKLMPATLPVTAAGLILMGVALNLIAVAMKSFGTMKWEEMGKGLLVLVEALGGIALGVSLMPPTLPLTAAGLILMGIALAAISGAIKSMGSLDMATIIKGLGTMMGAIAGIGLAMALVPPTIALTAAGIFIVANAMVVLSAAMRILGGMSLGEILKSLIAMGGALVVLGTGLIFMSGTLAGSAALMVAAVALGILAPTLAFLGHLSWGTIIKGLLAIGLALGTLAVVGLLASAPLSALGIALLPLAGVFVLTAAAVMLFAKAMSLLGAEGGKGVTVMVTALTAFVALIPKLVIDFIKGIVGILDEIVKLAPKIIEALGKILEMVIAFVIENAPKLATAIGALITAVLKVLVDNTPKIIKAGYKLLLDLLSGVSNNIGQVTSKVAQIITRFLNALTANAPKLISAGVKTLTTFLTGITSKIPALVTTVGSLITKFISSVAAQLPRIVAAAANMMVKFINAIGNYVGKVITAGTNMIIKFLDGIERAIPRIKNKALSVARTFVNNLADGLVSLVRIGFNGIIKFLNGLAQAIRDNDDRMINAGMNVADAIGDGLIKGLRRIGPAVMHAVENLIKGLPKKALSILGIHSPSTVFTAIGENTMLGMAQGLYSAGPAATNAVGDVTGDMVDTAKTSLSKMPTALFGIEERPVISPVLDLTQIRQDAKQLDGIVQSPTMFADGSYDRAAAIAAQRRILSQTAPGTQGATPTVSYTQNNYSPDPISNIELYRQTNNQLARIREYVGDPRPVDVSMKMWAA